MFENVKRIKENDIVDYDGSFAAKGLIVSAVWEASVGHTKVRSYLETESGAVIEVVDKPENYKKDIKKSLLRNDPITIAVNRCNQILQIAELEVKISKVTTSTSEGTEIPYGRLNGKLYTADTLKKLEAFEKQEPRIFPEEEK